MIHIFVVAVALTFALTSSAVANEREGAAPANATAASVRQTKKELKGAESKKKARIKVDKKTNKGAQARVDQEDTDGS